MAPSKSGSRTPLSLVDCRYDKARLISTDEISANSPVWDIDVTNDGDSSYIFTFRSKQTLQDAGVAVAFDRYGWSSDNYVMIPAGYNGNRQRIVNRQYATGLNAGDYYRRDPALTSNPIPQLSPEFGAPSKLEVLVCNAAAPAIAWLDRKNQEARFYLPTKASCGTTR